jgi:hypothetical protein
VRALAMVGRVVVLPASLLAGWGVLVLTERHGPAAAALIATALAALIAGERWLPKVAHATFGQSLTLDAFTARPPEEDVVLLRDHAQGALLDLPHGGGALQALGSGAYLMLAAFSPRPVAACYNSFPSPLEGQIGALALALPRAAAVDALVALGFETLLLHTERMEPKRVEFFDDLIHVDAALAERLERVGRTERLILYRMRSPVLPDHDPLRLTATAPDAEVRRASPGRQTLELTFRNATDRTYAQQAPIAPLPIEAVWEDPSGRERRHERVRALLPIALGPAGEARVPLVLDVPPPGDYRLTIHLAARPDAALSLTRVQVAAAAR